MYTKVICSIAMLIGTALAPQLVRAEDLWVADLYAAVGSADTSCSAQTNNKCECTGKHCSRERGGSRVVCTGDKTTTTCQDHGGGSTNCDCATEENGNGNNS